MRPFFYFIELGRIFNVRLEAYEISIVAPI